MWAFGFEVFYVLLTFLQLIVSAYVGYAKACCSGAQRCMRKERSGSDQENHSVRDLAVVC